MYIYKGLGVISVWPQICHALCLWLGCRQFMFNQSTGMLQAVVRLSPEGKLPCFST